MRYVLEGIIHAGYYLGLFWYFLTLCGMFVLAAVMLYYWIMERL